VHRYFKALRIAGAQAAACCSMRSGEMECSRRELSTERAVVVHKRRTAA